MITPTLTWKTATTIEAAQSSAPEELPALLGQALAGIKNLGPDFANDGAKLQALRERLAEERFHLAVLGQFKRGKSTLLNALLGEALLPTSIVPLTAIPTFLRAGSALEAHVAYQNSHAAETFSGRQSEDLAACLARFVTEEGNPHNHLGVTYVEVFHPAPLLHQGVVLIDTPGIGSTFRHNTEATLNFLPQCDAALFLVSADPPITEVEVTFLKEVRSKVTRLFFILNKADYLSAEERQTALGFFSKVLQEQVGLPGDTPIFCISARQGLQARQTGDAHLWMQSGLADVENHLLNFLVSEKSRALQVALGQKAYDLTAEVLMRLYLTIRSLQMPLAELEERSGLFEQKLGEAGQQRQTAADLLTGDYKRTVAYLEEQAEQLRQKARAYLGGIVRETVAQSGQAELTERCLASLERTSSSDVRVLLIDNGSDEFDSSRFRAALSRLRHWYCKLDSNTGFVKATNCGLAVSTAPYVLLLNNDTEVSPGWLEKLLEVLEKEPNVGIVGPLSSSPHQWQGQVAKGGTGWRVLGTHQMLSFFCALIRREVIIECGYLSERYAAGLADDDDYAEVIHRAGWRLALRLDLETTHSHRTTFRAVFGEGGWIKYQNENLQKFKTRWGK